MLEEALRYMGAAGAKGEERRRVAAVLAEAQQRFPPRFAYRLSTVEKRADAVFLPELSLELQGRMAAKMLGQCHHAAVLVCTLGLMFEQQVRAYQASDMVLAVMLDACGSALVESGCDQAERELQERFPGVYLTERFSPGYGDLPMNLQPGICAALDSRRRLGVYVSDSCMLTPQKSVTAVVGLADKPQPARIRGCAYCGLREHCSLRKEGRSCDV